MNKIRIGISTCLLGEPVRYDGQHKLDRFIRDTLGQYMEFVPVCPEVECGLPVPRESMNLRGDPAAPRLVTTRTHRDLTDQMLSWADRRVRELEGEGLCGFIFKANSPSSGMERVRVYDASGMPHRRGSGLFAAAFMRHFPSLPVEEDGRLNDPVLRENFISRLFLFQRWREVMQSLPGLPRGRAAGTLMAFHTRHKLLLLSHSPRHYRELGKLVAGAGDAHPEPLAHQYQTQLMQATALHATVAKHVNVLHHMLGYFKRVLTADEKKELIEIIDNFKNGHIPLIVPVTLVNHYVRKYDQPYLREQVYLNPHPLELRLRNHV